MKFVILVTGPPYGTQYANSAWLFANAVVNTGHTLHNIFFYREGIYNANYFSMPENDEHDLVRSWILFKKKMVLNCIFVHQQH